MTYTDIYKTCNLDINPDNKASVDDTYSAIVTGWTPKSKCHWSLFPNSLVRGNLYSKAGVDRLVNNLSHNPCIDRVYLIKLTPYDANSGAIDHAYQVLRELNFPATVVTSLDGVPCMDTGCRPAIKPRFIDNKPKVADTLPVSGLVIRGDNIELIQAKSQNYILKYGQYCEDREFTALHTITHVIDQKYPVEYEPYYDLWLKPRQNQSVEYTYGDYLVNNLDKLKEIDNSTQVTIHLELPGSIHPPCLALVQRWQNNLIAVFRSHDIGQAFIPNTKALIYLMQIAGLTGNLTVISNVAHVYDWDKPGKTPVFMADPLGNITGYRKEGCYFLEKNNTPWLKAHSKRGLLKKIARAFPVMDTEHSFYLADLVNKL